MSKIIKSIAILKRYPAIAAGQALLVYGLAPATLVLLFFFAAGCASTTAERDTAVLSPQARHNKAAPGVYHPCAGKKTPLAVLPMGLSKRAAERYPYLLKKSVGMGVHNMLADELYASGCFRLVEEKESVVEKVFRQQWLSASGAVDQGSAVALGKVLGARKVAYGEVYDYSEGKSEKVFGLKKQVLAQLRVGVQIRLVDVETLEYIPASGVGYGPDWNQACQQAISAAVHKLVASLAEVSSHGL